MSTTTRIEWCDATWNPVTGCTPVSDGCANCYAKRMAERFPQIHGCGGVPFSRIVWHEDRLTQPDHWRKPRRIFVCSMGDLFHKDISPLQRWRVLEVITANRRHRFLLLTKRPFLMELFFRPYPVPDNLWVGVTVETNAEVGRLKDLVRIKTPRRFVSIEPMLGPVDIDKYLHYLGWVIVGAETGPHKRQMFEWDALQLQRHCAATGVPFFFKKNNAGKPLLYGNEYHEFPKGLML